MTLDQLTTRIARLHEQLREAFAESASESCRLFDGIAASREMIAELHRIEERFGSGELVAVGREPRPSKERPRKASRVLPFIAPNDERFSTFAA